MSNAVKDVQEAKAAPRRAGGRPLGGKKFGGRQKGTQNKITVNVRNAMAQFAEGHIDKFTQWVAEVAAGAPTQFTVLGKGKRAKRVVLMPGRPADPAHAAELYLKAIEYHIPKLARTEITGKDGAPIETVSGHVVLRRDDPGTAMSAYHDLICASAPPPPVVLLPAPVPVTKD